MKKLLTLIVIFFFLNINSLSAGIQTDPDESTAWKAGVAKINITPQQPMWLNGYGARDRPSEGTLHDIWIKALALEDTDGRQAVIVTADILGLPKAMSDRIRDRIESDFGLSRAQILLNSSHTHTGPALPDALLSLYPVNEQQRKQVMEYGAELEDRFVELVGDALVNLEPARLFSMNGVVRFAVNRRNNESSTLHRQTELDGPSDHSVPVIKVEDKKGNLLAVAFGYACHPTALNFYKWSGDYPGVAQLELEKEFQGATALFFQGAGADQNPLPRRTVPLARQYGRELATAVRRVLNEDMRPLTSRLTTTYSEVDLQFSELPTKEELLEIEASSGSRGRWATGLLEKFEQAGSLPISYPYPVQVWRMGDQTLVNLGGELVVDYGIEIKRILGQDTFILGYSNDVMSYIPSARIIREGGYEGEHAQRVYGQPSTWNPNIEPVILREVVRLAEQAGVPKPESGLLDDD